MNAPKKNLELDPNVLMKILRIEEGFPSIKIIYAISAILLFLASISKHYFPKPS